MAGFLYNVLASDAIAGSPATDPGNYLLVGDSNGVIQISSVQFNPNPVVAGSPATGTLVLTFANPLPDDRYTLTIKDNVVDPAGNKLDGESNAIEPNEVPSFPSGDGQPGGNFVARFTVDSRPEIGTWRRKRVRRHQRKLHLRSDQPGCREPRHDLQLRVYQRQCLLRRLQPDRGHECRWVRQIGHLWRSRRPVPLVDRYGQRWGAEHCRKRSGEYQWRADRRPF